MERRSHLNTVVNTPELRDAYNACLPKITAFYTDLGQNERLYRKFSRCDRRPAFAALSPAAQRMIDNEMRDFRLGGAELDPASGRASRRSRRSSPNCARRVRRERARHRRTRGRITSTTFAELAGVPADVVAQARAAAAAEGRAGYKLTLRMPCYLPVMQYADDRELRADECTAPSRPSRATFGGNPDLDNAALIDRILVLRHEEAHAARLSQLRRGVAGAQDGADRPREVLDFLRDLARRARPFAERDFAELAAFARDELGLADLDAWDLAYASEKLKARRYAYSEQEVQAILPRGQGARGLFRLVETMFGVTIREASARCGIRRVRFFEMRDARRRAASGQFYFDLYAREGKRAARGWTMRSTAGALDDGACSIRSRT